MPSSWYAQLLPEQRRAADWVIKRIRDGGGAALFSQQRTGKTYITCAAIEQLKLQRVLVIAPRTAVDATWRPALATLGMPASSAEALAEAAQHFTALSYQEATKIVPASARRLLRGDNRLDLVVIDESQGIKARQSDQSRAARRFRDATRRLALSGTPIDDSPIDVWAQMRFVDHTVLGEHWTPFAEQYCYKGGFKGRKWIFREALLPQFLDALRSHIYRLTTDFLNLKPISLHLVPVMLLGRQEEAYHTMNKEGILQLHETAVATGSLPVTKLAKLEQITGGHILDDDNHPHRVGYAKERKLRWLMPRLTLPVVIFCRYLSELYSLTLGLSTSGYRVATLYGKVKGPQRAQMIADFDEGKYDVLIAQVRTGSVSVSFARSSNLVIYSMNHSYIDFEQLMFRLQGMTQSKEVQAWLLYCENTVDEDKVDRINRKKSTVFRVVSTFERSRNAEGS